MAAVIEIQNLVKNFVLPFTRKRIRALDSLSFSVQEGGIVGFLGANGAGKTTALKCILQLIFPDSGKIQIYGKEQSGQNLKSKIGFLTERPYFYDHLTGREFLKFCAQLYNSGEALSRVEPLLEEVGLGDRADRHLRKFSKGMLQRIGIAQALINDPKILILDEPMSGLDPDGRAEMSKIISKAHRRGATILFSTHLLPDVENLCERVIMIDNGKLVIESSVTELLSSHTSGYLLEFRKNQKIENKTFLTDSELQAGIDEVRKQGMTIERVAPIRPSLEEVFLKLKRATS